MKLTKCKLLQRRVGFLGHVVSEAGIATDPEKIKSVETWPTPTSLKEVRSFLGLCSYYRRFVQGFSEIASPLHRLADKNVPFIWTPECQLVFEELRLALTTTPLLAMPTDGDTYILDTDASHHAIGAVLSQVQAGEKRVIAYASRTYSKANLNYCTTRKELLAVVHFVKQFKQYLLQREFFIRTDHDALTWLQRTPHIIGQQARWQNACKNSTLRSSTGLGHDTVMRTHYRDGPADLQDALYLKLSQKTLFGRLKPAEVTLKRLTARCLHPYPESNPGRSHQLRHCLR